MLFNSFEFMIFLPIVFILYWFVFRKLRQQNFFVIVASYFFYGWWDWRFLFLIAFTSVCSFSCGLLIEHYQDNRFRQRMLSAFNITINLLILGVFKYYNFFIESLDTALSLCGIHLDWVTMNIVLPVGISFYTFQALSYTIDVFNNKIKATRDILAFGAYLSFFPQLVAGPIERATKLLPQFLHDRHFEYPKAVDGLRQMLWGLVKKVVIADNCASIVNTFWDSNMELNGLSLISLGVLFSIQIYCDFSGYSDIAIGCAKTLGIELTQNFRFPYFSHNIVDFWRRWHISLMTWFRDYLYIPLGGNRCGKWKTARNTIIVFLLSGLWHGANWTFVAWGGYHAILIIIYNWSGIHSKKQTEDSRLLPSASYFFQMMLTFSLSVIGWIIFRSENITHAFSFIGRMFSTLCNPQTNIIGIRMVGFGFLMLFVEWLQRDKQHALQLPTKGVFTYSLVRYCIYSGLLLLLFFCAGEVQTFIYFQF